jgi:hypothetical protein
MGDILGPSADLLSQVIAGDRKRTGRVHPEPPEAEPPDDGTTANTTGSEVGSATNGKRAEAPRARPVPERSRSKTQEAIAAEPEPAPPGNPLEAALREMLGRAYASDPAKGPYTVTSMKLNSEVSERLGWASSLTKRPKQDIVSEALRLYFERLLREG